MRVGSAIKTKRKEKSILQAELARRADITQSYLSQIENDKKEPNLDTLRRIAAALDMPLPFLIFFSVTDEDIPDERKEAFEAFRPKIEALIDTVLADKDSSTGNSA
jgi:transcriptional regulator with XRE-family HTH domain